MYRRLCQTVAMLAAVGLLAACEGTADTKGEEDIADTTATTDTGMGGATTQGLGAGSGFEGDPLDDPSSVLANRVIYFDFDSSAIREVDRAVIDAHAEYLATHPSASVTLEGHADERGTREYNVALGDRRSNSVRRTMSLLGASGSQLRTISYGEERPAVDGHDESAWSLNRRVEIIYRTR